MLKYGCYRAEVGELLVNTEIRNLVLWGTPVYESRTLGYPGVRNLVLWGTPFDASGGQKLELSVKVTYLVTLFWLYM